MAGGASWCCDASRIAGFVLIALVLLTAVLMAFLQWLFAPIEALLGPLLSLRGCGWVVVGILIWLMAGRPAGQARQDP